MGAAVDLATTNKDHNNYDIKRLYGKQKEILRLRASGLYSNKEIADILGVGESTISCIVNSALGKQMLEMMENAVDFAAVDLMKQVRSLAPVALAIQTELLLDEGTDRNLKNKIADKLVDRTLGTPVSRNINMNVDPGVTTAAIDKIKERAKELREKFKKAEETIYENV